jgi:uncharacterized protein
MLTLFAAALLLAQAAPLGPRTVHSFGEGRISVAPDVARVVVGVDVQDQNLARANADATARMNKVMAAIEKAGVAASDVQTLHYSVEVQRSYERPNAGTVTGYRVQNGVAVTVRDVRRLGGLLEQVVAAGANDLGGVWLDKRDISSERARALERAMADARARASVLAKAAGGALGDALQVDEAGAFPNVPLERGARKMRMAAAETAAPVSTGELEIVANVDVVFALR